MRHPTPATGLVTLATPECEPGTGSVSLPLSCDSLHVVTLPLPRDSPHGRVEVVAGEVGGTRQQPCLQPLPSVPEEAHDRCHGQERGLDSLAGLMRAPGQPQHPGVVTLLRQRVVRPDK